MGQIYSNLTTKGPDITRKKNERQELKKSKFNPTTLFEEL